MIKMKKKAKTRVELEREIKELKGQLANSYYLASKAVEKASADHLMASGAVLTITALGGREIVDCVVIRDGLSNETIAAIKSDLMRSYDLATKHKPKE